MLKYNYLYKELKTRIEWVKKMEEKKLTGYPSVDKPWLKYYSEEAKSWKLTAGEYLLSLGFSSEDLRINQNITIKQNKLRPVTDILKPATGDIFIK